MNVKRWLVIVAGFLIMIVGILLTPVPGPGGGPIMLAGLALLSTELPWARRLFRELKKRLRVEGSPRRRVVLIAGLVIVWIAGSLISWRLLSDWL